MIKIYLATKSLQKLNCYRHLSRAGRDLCIDFKQKFFSAILTWYWINIIQNMSCCLSPVQSLVNLFFKLRSCSELLFYVYKMFHIETILLEKDLFIVSYVRYSKSQQAASSTFQKRFGLKRYLQCTGSCYKHQYLFKKDILWLHISQIWKSKSCFLGNCHLRSTKGIMYDMIQEIFICRFFSVRHRWSIHIHFCVRKWY